ncbi:MAG: DUF3515 domain-containing protein [Pseudonocardia sp.]|nr:DUF3515 domain-containing protein [Pseudonocardia sp.]
MSIQSRSVRTRHPATIALIALPLLLVLAAAALGIVTRWHASEPSPVPDRPLALPPVEAPDASGQWCHQLVTALPTRLAASPQPLPRLVIADPAPPGALAWGRSTEPDAAVVLRCGLPRPVELTPGTPLLEIDGVRWLTLSETDRDTFISVDRPVFIALTVPRGLGSGPVQTVSDTVRTALPGR